MRPQIGTGSSRRLSLCLSLLSIGGYISQVHAAPLQQATAPDQITFNAPSASSALSFALPTLESLGLSHDLLNQLQSHIKALPEKRIVRFETGLGSQLIDVEVTEGEKSLLVYMGKRFEDVTDEQKPLIGIMAQTAPLSSSKFPSKLSYKASFLEPLFVKIDINFMKSFLKDFSGFRTRYYRSSTGKDSQQFLLKTLKDIAGSNSNLNISITEFPHSWGQNSIIARFDPKVTASVKKQEPEIVILGAHQDSTNMLPFLPAPGADDDGSGTTTIVASFSALVNSSFVPDTNPVEFHWYSAEEGGLLGSQAVAQSYAAAGKRVKAMLQMDMTAWVKKGTTPTIGIITDFVDPGFTDVIRMVVEEYAEIGSTDTKCGYACSDHASWSKIGAPSAFTIESTFENSNHNIHSGSDRIDYSEEFSFEHMKQFSRIAIALAVELGGGKSLE